MSDGEFSQKLLAALPADPFEQLEVAQRLTSRAVAAGVSKLETETGRLRQKLSEKDATIISMQHCMADLEQTLQDTSFRLSQALESQDRVINENNMLVSTVQKLKREISKQMEDAETASQPTFADSASKGKVDGRGSSVLPSSSDNDDLYGARLTMTVSDPATTLLHDDCGNTLASISMSPSVRGSKSTFRRSEAGMQAKTSLSPARKSTHHSMSAVPGQVPKVDGKEFFRQARNRLSYQQFSAFLSNIKELNSHRQSRGVGNLFSEVLVLLTYVISRT